MAASIQQCLCKHIKVNGMLAQTSRCYVASNSTGIARTRWCHMLQRTSTRCSASSPQAEQVGNRFKLQYEIPAKSLRTTNYIAGATYSGTYGPWQLTQTDVYEVYAYRIGLGAAASGMALGTVGSLFPSDSSLYPLVAGNLNLLSIVGASGLGLSLSVVHMYLGSIKKTIQAFYAAGVLGGLYLMTTQDVPLPLYVADHRQAVWLIGPFFAALTGLSIKEGLCYGKAEATLVAATTPILLMGHLTGLLGGNVEKALLLCMTGGLSVLAARKWTQPLKDDIGDKSVFIFQQLPEEEQMEIMMRKEEGRL